MLAVTKNRTLPFSKACPNPLKNGPKPLAKLYISPKNSRAPTALKVNADCTVALPPAHAFGSIFSNCQHFALCTGSMGVACPLPAFGGKVRGVEGGGGGGGGGELYFFSGFLELLKTQLAITAIGSQFK